MKKAEESVVRRGDEGGGKKEDPEAEVSMLPPRSILFTPEQVSQMNHLYEQAPWLYGTPQSVFTPFTTVQRPASLVQEEVRSKEEDGSARSVNPQVEIWRSAIKEHQMQREEMMRSALKEQSEKSEMVRMMQEMIKENQALRKRIEEIDQRSVKEEGDQYLTPDSNRRPSGEDEEKKGVGEEEGGQDSEEESESEEAPRKGKSKEKFTKQSMKFMVLMMETMKEFQKSIGGAKEDGVVRGVEVVRTGSPDLPLLAQWDAQTGPLQLGDWLLLVEPIVSDLSVTANEWWKLDGRCGGRGGIVITLRCHRWIE